MNECGGQMSTLNIRDPWMPMVEIRVDPALGCSRSIDQVMIFANQLRLRLGSFSEVVADCVWWPVEASSVNCACVFAACGERQRP